MTSYVRKRQRYKPFIYTMISAWLGLALTLLLLGVFAALILNGQIKGPQQICILVSVYLGSFVTAEMVSHLRVSVVTVGVMALCSYLTLLLMCALTVLKGEINGNWFLQTTAAAASGDITLLVTKLVKSNKSYINKSKRKR